MNSYKADLHCHSYFSDGALSPAALLEKALAVQVQCLALTDHDTTAGSKELRNLADPEQITIVDGIELSVRWKMHDIHIVGLNIDPSAPALMTLLEKQGLQRTQRAEFIATALENLGIVECLQKAREIAGQGSIGRPHFAQVLINEGKVRTMQAAFTQYLGRGKKAYVPTSWISIEEAVSGIVQAGGQAIIAHPLKYKLTRTKLHALIEAFKNVGGVAIEVVSGEMNVAQIGEMVGLTQRFDLLASTGSDYHSDEYSIIGLGQQRPLPTNCKPIWELWKS